MSNFTQPTFDSSTTVKEFYDRYFTRKISYPASEVDAVIGYFQKRGFDETAARAVASVLLQQSKIDGIKVFTLLDTLKGLNNVQLSTIVTEVLNYNRPRSSTLGFRNESNVEFTEARNIIV